jgi:DNA-binding Xre family transcriptional regulator
LEVNMDQERTIKVDSRRLDVALAAAGIRTDNELAEKSGVDERTIRNVRRLGSCSFKVLNNLADAIGCNPIDLLVTPGYPDPKWEALAALLV